MNVQSIAALVFILIMVIFLFLNRKKIEVQKILFPLLYFVMYRTRLGLDWMDRIAKRVPRTLHFIGIISIIAGFLGMGLITYELTASTLKLFLTPEAPPSVKPVLPFEAKGVFFVPFIYWITAIFLIAAVHEFAHGVMARVYKLNVKSSGFAFLGIIFPVIPAAFVEPDEKKIVKKTTSEQLAIFSAGAFANVIFAGLVFLIIAFAINPVASKMIDLTGVKVTSITKESPADIGGITAGELITRINDMPVTTLENFTTTLKKTSPGTRLRIVTNQTSHVLIVGASEKDASKPYLGVMVAQGTKPNDSFIKRYGENTTAFLRWFFGLLYWLFLLNLGIGLFNLVPIGPIDGGRMLHLVLTTYLPKKTGLKVFSWISFILLAMLLINVVIGFIR